MASAAPRPQLGHVSPFFIVRSIHESLAFYRDRLGFDVYLLIPEPEPFFAIVQRGSVQLMLKEVGDGVAPQPNPVRHPNARWDAYVEAPDPDALAAEFTTSGVTFSGPLADWDDGLRGFELRDHDGYVLFFGCPTPPESQAGDERLATIDAVQPVIEVRDVTLAIRFYERLGFKAMFRDDPDKPMYAGVRRDGAEVHLQWHDASEWDNTPTRPNYRFVVPDPDLLFAEFQARAGTLDQTPVQDTPWGTREFHVRDPDGNGLQFYRDL